MRLSSMHGRHAGFCLWRWITELRWRITVADNREGNLAKCARGPVLTIVGSVQHGRRREMGIEVLQWTNSNTLRVSDLQCGAQSTPTEAELRLRYLKIASNFRQPVVCVNAIPSTTSTFSLSEFDCQLPQYHLHRVPRRISLVPRP
ncbi:hypothetical protein HBH56_148650 [Parastagonospora nodorum]|nr:hypothetical protein HBH56_148650 [Parastagonospora nodorum]KAH3923264.1 hypothetical protein HBH54_213290 [Parastagonospora nodorum]KAH3945986.1 hypothetical protein HBH53_136100 [Parastagonospora nodorum]KAH3984044.1 hypothetical protein HBH52_063910 [Parastagonospora nodorum]KAH3985671.1 hypothetical protein HBH51_022680 [Parastagonospora nodorum]